MVNTGCHFAAYKINPLISCSHRDIEPCARTWYLSRNTSGLLLYWCSSSSRRSSRVSSASPFCWLFTRIPLAAMASNMAFTQIDSAWLTYCAITRRAISLVCTCTSEPRWRLSGRCWRSHLGVLSWLRSLRGALESTYVGQCHGFFWQVAPVFTLGRARSGSSRRIDFPPHDEPLRRPGSWW